MKKKLFYFSLLPLLVFCVAGTIQETGSPKTLRFSGIPRYSLSVGYGNVYACALTKNPYKGLLKDTVSLVFLAGDVMEKQVKEGKEQTFVFSKHQVKAPYAMNPLTGLTDQKRTTWKLVSVE